MTLSKIARAGTILAAVALIGACSSTGRVSYDVGNAAKIPVGKTASLDVRINDPDTKAEEVQAAELIRAELMHKLPAQGVFKSVRKASDSADYSVDVNVVRVAVTTPGARVALGAFAPRSEIQVAVEVRDKASKEVIAAFHASGYGSRMWTSAQGYGLDDPVREVVNQIVVALR